MANVYDEGDLVRVSGAFTDCDDAAVDPTVVTCKYKDPGGDVTTLVYGTDVEVVKDSTGNYHVDVDCDEVGTWHYRWAGTGTYQAAGEGEFYVGLSQF